MRNPRDCRATKVTRPRAQTCCTFQIQIREIAWELTFLQPGLCALKQTDKKSHCSAHSQSCCFTALLARINKNVVWKRDFLVAVEKPWPKCCTLEASNNLYWQQESKMENVVLIPPTLSLSCFLMHRYVLFFLHCTFSECCHVTVSVSFQFDIEPMRQSGAGSDKCQNDQIHGVPTGKKRKNLWMCRVSGWLICLACLFRWFIVTNGWNNLGVWCLHIF